MKDKAKIYETSLVLTTGFLILYMLTGNAVFLYISIIFGLSGIFVEPLAAFYTKLWFWLANILNLVFSKLLLGLLFYLILLPLAIFYKASGNNKLRLKNDGKSNWTTRNHFYESSHFKKIW